MANAVKSGAVTACTQGTCPSVLLVPGDPHNTSVGADCRANIGDHIPFANIVPFGLCKSSFNPFVVAAMMVPQPCVQAFGNSGNKAPDKKPVDLPEQKPIV